MDGKTFVALDLETEEINRMPEGKIHGVWLCGEDLEPCCYPWGMTAEVELEVLLDDPTVTFVIQNAKYDVDVLRHHGIDIPQGRYVDTMVLAHCINPQRGVYSLESYGAEIDEPKLDYKQALINAGMWEDDGTDAYYNLPFNTVMEAYGRQDVYLTMKWWQSMQVHLERDSRLAESYFNIHLPAVETTMSMQGGLYINRKRTLMTAAKLQAEIEQGYEQFAKDYPLVTKLSWKSDTKEFKVNYHNGKPKRHAPNIASPNDIVSLLLERGWKPEEFKRETGRPVTSQAILLKLAKSPDTPTKLKQAAESISSLRSLVGIMNQLMQALELVNDRGFLKPNWWQTGTKTFRYSSSSPNCQNWSTRHPIWGKQVRAIFEPPPGYSMFMGDLSQIELAIVAWYLEVLCNDSAAAEGNRQGKDAHDTNTENWYGVSKDDPMFKLLRGKAKNGAFAANYGALAKRLALTIGCTVDEAQDILDTVESATQITPLKELVWETMRQPRDIEPISLPGGWRKTRSGVLYDCLNTRLFYPDINSTDRAKRESAQRQSFNALAQGGCASILRKLCNQSLPYIQQGKGWIAALVHDEMLGYVKTEYAEETLVHLNREWNSLVLPSKQGGVYVRADFKLVTNWSDKN